MAGWLDRAEPEGDTTADPQTSSWLDRADLEIDPAAEDAQLRAIFAAAKNVSGDAQAQALEVASVMKVPPSVVASQIGEWRQRMEAAEFDPVKFKERSPALAALMLKRPQLAPAVALHQATLERLEGALSVLGMVGIGPMVAPRGAPQAAGDMAQKAAKDWDTGKLQARLERLAIKQRAGTATPAELEEADNIEQELAFIAAVTPQTGFFGGIPGEVAKQIPRYLANASDVLSYTGGAAAGGAAVGAVVGGIGAVPGAIGGAVAGLTGGVYKVTADAEGALFYRDQVKKGIDPSAAGVAADIVGVANGLLEAAPLDKVLRIAPGAKRLLQGPVASTMSEMLRKPGVAETLSGIGARAVEAGALEGVTEALQAVVPIYTAERLRGGANSDALAAVWSDLVAAESEIRSSAVAGAQGGVGMHVGSPFAIVESVGALRDAHAAEQRAQFWEALGEASRGPLKELPEATAAVVEALQEQYGVAGSLSVPADKLTEFFDSAGISKAEVADKLPGVAAQLDSQAPGLEVVIPTKDYAAVIAPHAAAAGLVQDIRVGDTPTAREAPEVAKEAEAILTEMDKNAVEPARPGRVVFESLRSRMLALDVAPGAATQNAALWQAIVEARAARLGVDPLAYFRGLNLQIERGEIDDLTARERATTLTQPVGRVQKTPWDYGQGAEFTYPGTPFRLLVSEDGAAPQVGADRTLHVSMLTLGDDSVRGAREWAGKGYATTLYLAALRHAKDAGMAFSSDVYRSDSADVVYQRLQRLGVPFKEMGGDGPYGLSFFHLTAEDLGKVDLDKVEREMEAAAEIQKLRGEAPSSVPRLDSLLAKVAPLEQSEGGAVRGGFRTNQAREFFKITLTGKANLSTFIHESGHALLAILDRDAQTDEKSAADVQVIRDWLGSTGTARWTRDQQEKFARGFEAYLWEGKAPSSKLAEVFDTVKTWLRYLYTTLLRLDVELTDDVRGVMDRLLATDVEIADARQKLGLVPPEDATGMMSPEAYEAYRQTFERAVRTAREAADRASLREFKRTMSDEREAVQRSVEEASRANPALQAREVLLTGKTLEGADADAAVAGKKLDAKWVRAAYPTDAKARARLRPFLVQEGGVDPDLAAGYLGYKTGLDLVQALAATPSTDRWIREETDRRMTEKYPGYANTREWNQLNAHRALHEDAVGNALWAGMVALGAKLGGTPGKTVRMAIKEAAQRRAEGMQVLELRPYAAIRAESAAAKAVAEAWKAGDARAAYEAGRAQLFNHYLWREIEAAQGEVAELTAYFKRFEEPGVRRKISKGGEVFLQAIDGILQTVEFGRVLEQSVPLSDILAALREQGMPVLLPENFEAFAQPYESLRLGDLRAIRQGIQNLEHLARQEANQIIAGERRSFAEAVQLLASHIGANRPPAAGSERGNPYGMDWLAGNLRSGDWHLRKIEFLARMLDGGRTAGLAHRMLFQPIADAEAREHTMYKAIFTQLRTEFSRLSLQERLQHDKLVPFLPSRDSVGPVHYSLRDVMAIALQFRNEGNIQRLLETTGWDREAVLARLDELLSDKDLEIINKLGALAGSLWEPLAETYKRSTGVAPEQVIGAPVTLPSGRVIDGGYYPIIKDPRQDRAGVDVLRDDLWDPEFTPVAVAHGMTETRSARATTPIWLSLDALPHHLVKTIHYITHYEATRLVDRLASAPSVRDAIQRGVSREAYSEIRPWLMDIARGSESGTEPLGGLERFLRHSRTGASVVLLGGKLAVATLQALGLTMTAKELAAQSPGGVWRSSSDVVKYMGFGTREVLRDVASWLRGGPNPFDAIAARDPSFVLHRENYDRDLRLEYRRLTSAFSEFGRLRGGVTEFSMMFFNLVQGTVNAITWHGAYQMAVDQGHPDPTAFAAATVRMSQSSGGPKDLARIQRGSEYKKLLTVMFSFRNLVYNQLREAGPADKGAVSRAATKMAHFWWIVLLPAVVSVALRGTADDVDDPEEYLKAVGMESLLFTARSIPVVSDVATGLEDRDAKLVPWIDMQVKATRAARHAIMSTLDAGEEVSDKDVENFVNFLGVMGHLPTGAGVNAVKFLEQAGEMEEPVANAAFRSPRAWR